MKVVDIKFYGGDEILAELIEEDGDKITVKHAVFVMPVQNEPSEVNLVPYLQYGNADQEIVLDKTKLVMGKPHKGLVDMMNNKFSPIIQSKTAELILS